MAVADAKDDTAPHDIEVPQDLVDDPLGAALRIKILGDEHPAGRQRIQAVGPGDGIVRGG